MRSLRPNIPNATRPTGTDLPTGVSLHVSDGLPAFPKTYCIAAAASWLLTHLLVLISTVIFVPEDGFELLQAMSTPLALPVMLVAILALAAFRRELYLLWNYREEWVGNPASNLLQICDNKDGFQALPCP